MGSGLFMTASAQSEPTFAVNQDPKPSGQQWVLVENISDEFSDSTLDETKWFNTDPRRWRGRVPGIFKQDVVSMEDGKLRITVRQLTTPEVVNGDTYTHAGGNLYSKNAGQVGMYYECRMKANQTFMSSTFWLINTRNEGSGCDQRVTELDIQECVGEVVTSANWAQSFDQSMHSNTHSRNTSCAATPTGSQGGNVATSVKVWEDYHVYGAWWKSPTEIEFYLDGEKVYTVTPAAEFNLPMYLRLVTETYDWNPVPADGGMTGTFEERTTYYDWVRSWRLEQGSTNLNVNEPNSSSINIRPNPATDGSVAVELENYFAPVQISLLDLQGRTLYSVRTSQSLANVPLEGVSPGLYFVEVKAETGKQVQRLMVR